MEVYKLRIFVRAIKSRMKLENKTAEEIIIDYVKLTEEEKAEILTSIATS